MPDVLLTCGDRAMSEHMQDHDSLGARHPSCIIHDCCAVATSPNLEGRFAKCYYYGKMPYKNECNYGGKSAEPCACVQPSSLKLPFFAFQGEGSLKAYEACKNCRYIEKVHSDFKVYTSGKINHCNNFEAHGSYEFDEFYCGCHSWD